MAGIVIAIAGKMGSGKTSVAEALGVTYNKHKFAGLLHEMNSVVFPGESKNRKWMLDMAAAMRGVHNSIFTQMTLNKVREDCVKQGGDCVIDDLRQKTEMEALRNSGMHVFFVRLICDKEVRRKRVGEKNWVEVDNALETELDFEDFDLTIDTTKEDVLQTKARILLHLHRRFDDSLIEEEV